MLKFETITYIDWSQLKDAVEKELGYSIRDYTKMPVKDFWHWWTRYDDKIHNGYVQYDVKFTNIYLDAIEDKEPEWILKILEAFNKVLGAHANTYINILHRW